MIVRPHMAQDTQNKEAGDGYVPPGQEAESEGMVAMTFGEHLDELRRRLLISILAVVVVMAFFLFQKDKVMDFVTRPYKAMWQQRFDDWWVDHFEPKVLAPEVYAKLRPSYRDDVDLIVESRVRIRDWDWDDDAPIDLEEPLKRFKFKLQAGLISVKPLQDFFTFMLAAALCGLGVAFPIVLHQVWRFIAAGLYARERRAVMSYLPASMGLFLGGMLFGFYVMVPTALYFLTGLANTTTMLTVADYFRFLFMLTIALGFVFQLPVLMVALVRVGVTTPEFYIKYWRHVVLGIFVVGAILTPPDPFTQAMMAVPMVLLFLIGLFFSKLVAKRKQKEAVEGGDSAP